MAIQYVVIAGRGCRLVGWDWQFESDTYGAEETASYSVWMVPGTADPTEQ